MRKDLARSASLNIPQHEEPDPLPPLHKILLVSANPRDTQPVRIQSEIHIIREAIKQAPKDQGDIVFDIIDCATVNDLQRELMKDYTIVQFSGHGTEKGLQLENEHDRAFQVPREAFAELIGAHAAPKGTIQCLVLNACHSISQGEMCQSHVDYTICVEGPIADDASLEFSRGFYAAICHGKPIDFAYASGRRCVHLNNKITPHVPCLLTRRSEEPATPAPPPAPSATVQGTPPPAPMQSGSQALGSGGEVATWTASTPGGKALPEYWEPSRLTTIRPRTIAVTGSMNVGSREIINQRVENSLSIFLGRGVRWLVGSWGDADQASAEFLSSRGESVTIVGYRERDISPEMFQLAEDKCLPFVNAGSEKLPRLCSGGQNPRELFFLLKADMVVFFWANQSQGVKSLIDWYISNDKDVLVCTI